MKFYLSAKKLDIFSGEDKIVIINRVDAEEFGVGLNSGDRVKMISPSLDSPIIVTVDISNSIVKEGEIGLYKDIWKDNPIAEKEIISISLLKGSEAINSIRKKLLGERLDYRDFYNIMEEIATGHLNDVLTTYFVSAGYSPGFDDEEIMLMTRALAMTGDILKFDGIVADKHSIGGVGGKGITPLVVPIVASNGVVVPNTSTRAITSASATTDMLEVIMPMSFEKKELELMIDKVGAFMVWGGSLDLAPADDEIIRVQKQIGIESIDKFVSSIMAKKIAQGVKYVIFDVPVGLGAKIQEDKYPKVKELFVKLGKEFNIYPIIHKRIVNWIDGSAIGPSLECREFLYVYERNQNRSLQLEEEALIIAGKLLEATGKATKGEGYLLAKETLLSGKAFRKFQEIVQIQGGDPEVSSDSLEIGGKVYEYRAKQDGKIIRLNNKRVFEVAKSLGNPRIKEAGMYFHIRPNQVVKKGDLLVTLYATTDTRLDLGKNVINQDLIFSWETG